MRPHKRLTPIVKAAEQERRCFYVSQRSDRKAVHRRLDCGDFVVAHRSLYARTEYWNALNPVERTMHIVRGMAMHNPQRVFAGSSAAALFGWEQSWALHRSGNIYIATSASTCVSRSHAQLKRVYVKALESHTVKCSFAGMSQVVLATSPARTLVDCALLYSFAEALPMFDSALRKGMVSVDDVIAVCDELSGDCGHVFRLLNYADPASENGGESLCRAMIIEQGFAVPKLQRVFPDPDNTYDSARADFVWFLPDGRIVVLEYDGMRKYVDPMMAGRHGVVEAVQGQLRRDALLKRAGVSEIVHVTYDEVIAGAPLAVKLDAAGVPDLGHVLGHGLR